MIAYNHCIKFISLHEDEEGVCGQGLETLIVEQRVFSALREKLKYTLLFFNNQGREIMLHSDKDMIPTEPGRFWAFEIRNVVTFYWFSGEKELGYVRSENFSEALLKYWALHIVLPVYFTVEGFCDFLHAGAVEVEGKPILFTAASFGGKSTMTDFFMKQGHMMIADDKVGMYEKDGTVYAVPSHPHHRPYRKVEELGYTVDNFALALKPVHAIYLLEKTCSDAAVDITPVRGMEKLIALRKNSEMNLFFLQPERLAFLGTVCRHVPLFKVQVPWDIDKIGDVYGAIVKHARNCSRGEAG